MKFKFSYQQLLEYRKRLEELAQRDYLLSRKNVDDAETELESMYQQIDDSRKRAQSLESKGGKQAPSLVLIDDFINNHKIRIELQRKKRSDKKPFESSNSAHVEFFLIRIFRILISLKVNLRSSQT